MDNPITLYLSVLPKLNNGNDSDYRGAFHPFDNTSSYYRKVTIMRVGYSTTKGFEEYQVVLFNTKPDYARDYDYTPYHTAYVRVDTKLDDDAQVKACLRGLLEDMGKMHLKLFDELESVSMRDLCKGQ